MADNKKCGYAGSISSSGSQVVKSPLNPNTKKGKTIAKTGSDLRTGK